MSRIRQSRISSLRPVLRMLGWSSRPLVRGNEDAGYEGIYAFVRLIVRQATYNLVPRVFLFKKREDIGARLRLPRVNKTTDMKRWNNKHVHHKIFMEIKVISCYLQFNIMQSLHLFTLPPLRSLNKHHLMPLNIYYIYIYIYIKNRQKIYGGKVIFLRFQLTYKLSLSVKKAFNMWAIDLFSWHVLFSQWRSLRTYAREYSGEPTLTIFP